MRIHLPRPSAPEPEPPRVDLTRRIPRPAPAPRPTWVAITPGSAKRTGMLAVGLVVAFLVGRWAFESLSGFLFLLLLSWLLAIAMEPPVVWLSRHGIRRRLATALVMLALILLTIGTLVIFGGVFFSQASALTSQLPQALSATIRWSNEHLHTNLDARNIQSQLNITPDKIGDLAGKLGGGLLGVVTSLMTFLFDALTILVFAYYLCADSVRLRQTIASWLPARHQPIVITVWQIAVEKTGGYVISKLVLASISAAAHVFFFWAIDLPFWLPLGVLAGIVGQFIPTIGTYIGILIPAMFTLMGDPVKALWIIGFATIYQQVENYVFTPKVSKRTMDVHPAVALAAVFVGAGLFGPMGALIGIPMAAAALTILDTFRRQHALVPELEELSAEDDGRENGMVDETDRTAEELDLADRARAALHERPDVPDSEIALPSDEAETDAPGPGRAGASRVAGDRPPG